MLGRALTVVTVILLVYAGGAYTQPDDFDEMPGHPGFGWGKFKGGHGAMMGMGMHQPVGGMRCVKGIDLTGEQKEKLAKMQRDHHREQIDRHSDMAGKRAKIKLMITDDNFSKSDAQKYAKEIGEFHREQVEAKIMHMRQVRDLLTDEQRVIFDKNVLQMGDHFGPGHGKGFRHMSGHGRGPGRCAW